MPMYLAPRHDAAYLKRETELRLETLRASARDPKAASHRYAVRALAIYQELHHLADTHKRLRQAETQAAIEVLYAPLGVPGGKCA